MVRQKTAEQEQILMHNNTVHNNNLLLSKTIKIICKISPGQQQNTLLSFCKINQYPLSQTHSLSDSPQVLSTISIRIRLCAPQGLSLYPINTRRLNPTLLPVCVLSVRAPKGPEGAAPQPKMSIIYRGCEQDFISKPNTSYFKTQYLSVRSVCLAGAKLRAISTGLTASRGIMFRYGT